MLFFLPPSFAKRRDVDRMPVHTMIGVDAQGELCLCPCAGAQHYKGGPQARLTQIAFPSSSPRSSTRLLLTMSTINLSWTSQEIPIILAANIGDLLLRLWCSKHPPNLQTLEGEAALLPDNHRYIHLSGCKLSDLKKNCPRDERFLLFGPSGYVFFKNGKIKIRPPRRQISFFMSFAKFLTAYLRKIVRVDSVSDLWLSDICLQYDQACERNEQIQQERGKLQKVAYSKGCQPLKGKGRRRIHLLRRVQRAG
jgi:hypothetical protein